MKKIVCIIHYCEEVFSYMMQNVNHFAFQYAKKKCIPVTQKLYKLKLYKEWEVMMQNNEPYLS